MWEEASSAGLRLLTGDALCVKLGTTWGQSQVIETYANLREDERFTPGVENRSTSEGES